MYHPRFVVVAASIFLMLLTASLAQAGAAGRPDLVWGSLLAGNSFDQGSAVAFDAAGNTWVVGSTGSSDFPVPGGFQTTVGGGGIYDGDVFIAKITSTGTLAWATYLGGGGSEYGCGIAVDRLGNVWITGYTNSIDFPTAGAFQNSNGGEYDAFVAKITPSGALAFSSYFGGSDYDCGYGIAADASGNAWVVGSMGSENVAMPGGFQTSLGGYSDVFVAKVSRSGNLVWASYYGGVDDDSGYAIAIDSTGNAWVTGDTYSNDLPVPGGFDTTLDGYTEAFAARITPAGALAWASYLGGTDRCEGDAIAIDSTGNAWVVGRTSSTDLPTPGGFQTEHSSAYLDCYVARITPWGTLSMASYFGGAADTYGFSINIDPLGGAWMTGTTKSSDLSTPEGLNTTFAGYYDAFVARITPSGTLGWASYLGGDGAEYGCGIATDAWYNTWVTGWTDSRDFPTPGGFQTDWVGNTDAFVSKIQPHAPEDVNWLEITKLQIGMPSTAAHDSLVLQATCNMWPGGAAPTVTLSLDSTWSLVVDASSWKRSGKSNVYTAKQAGVNCKMTCWVNNTSKCLLQFTGSRQTIGSVLPDPSSVPVRVQIGSIFYETVVAAMTVKNHVAKLNSRGPLPLFYPERLTVTRNKRLADRDALSFSGKVFLDGSFDPALDGVAMTLGPYEISLPAGTMQPANKGVVKYATTTAHGRMTFQMNANTHVLTVTATGVDLSAMSQDTKVSLSITNHDEAAWDYWVFTSKNKTKTLYKY